MKGRTLTVLGLLAAFALLAGCATSPASPGDAKPVPADRAFAFQAAPTASQGVAVVARDVGFEGSGCGLVVSVDGQKAAQLGAGEVTRLSLAAGDHLMTVETSSHGLCSVGASAQTRTLKFNLRAGQESSFRIGSLSSGDIALAQTSI